MPVWSAIKRILIGAPIPTWRAHHERLSVALGLPVFASDAISSVAYATEEVLLVLAMGGIAALQYVTPISLVIVALVGIVVMSYIRTIYAYPQGGGGYRVTSDNLGRHLGLVAGAALLIDYVLTVAVSVSSGVLALVSAQPVLQPYMVHIGITVIAIISIINLRGARESGLVFAIPVYTFVFLLLIMIITGVGYALQGIDPVPETQAQTLARYQSAMQPIGLWLLLRAFAAGCTALTGIEAVADGAGAFRKPEAYNASRTLIMLGVVLALLFSGVSWLSYRFGVTPIPVGDPNFKTVLAQLAEGIFQGKFAFMFYFLQFATLLILFLAANTAFADFPRLSSFIARDGYMPRQLANLGDRLVFQNGIILLAFFAGFLLWIFHGDTHKLIPLYTVGVFTSFTLSQAAMALRQWRMGVPFLQGTLISLIGALATGVAMVVILVAKFAAGAWIVVVAALIMLYVFYGIKRHYNYLARELSLTAQDKIPSIEMTAILLVPRLHRGILNAIAYAKNIATDLRALHIVINPETVEDVKKEWEQYVPDISLVIMGSEYRSLVEPLMEYIDQAVGERENHMLTVIVPQAVPKYWWHRILHNNAAIPIKLALASRKNVVVTDVRYFLK